MGAALVVALLVGASGAVSAAAAPTGPASQAATPGAPIVAIPAPGSATSSPATSVTISGADPAVIGAVTVTGSRSGPHAGQLTSLSQGQGVTFTPEVAFAAGETVEVTSAVVVTGADDVSYSFTVATPAPDPGFRIGDEASPPDGPDGRSASPRAAAPRFATRPDLRPPGIDINVAASGAAPGLIFSTPFASEGAGTDHGVMVYDNAGQLVWFHPASAPGTVLGDAFVTTYAGAPALVWFEGTAPYGAGSYRGEWVVVDSSYREVARIRMGNGYRADLHDIRFTDHGSAYLMAYNPVICTGAAPLDACTPGATVLEGVVQEVDLGSGQVLWEWHSLDHIPLQDGYLELGAPRIDYFHINSLDLDGDGNVLMTARNTSAMYKVDRTNGGLIWAFGGKRTSFPNLVGSPSPASGPDFPHHVQARGGGSYSYFDNGVRRDGPSRGEIVTLDPGSGTATYTTTLERPNPVFSQVQGSMQGLPGGRNLVSWGNTSIVTEFDASGNVVFEADVTAACCYRQLRHEWTGAPASSPVARANAAPGGTSVAVGWNGDTRTARWRILAGQGAGSLSPVATVDRTGFETTATVPGRPTRVAVEALDGSGQVIGRSEPVAGGQWFSETAGPSVAGSYQPLVGDFGGSRNDDVIYYRPGAGTDYLHVSDGAGGFDSTALPRVNGDYTPLVGDFVGDDRDEVLWTRAGLANAALWRFDLAPRSGPVSTTSVGTTVPARVTRAVVLDHRPSYGGGSDEVLFYAAGSAPDRVDHFRWNVGSNLSRTSRAISVNGSYSPVSGDYDGNGQADVLWYAPGGAPDFIWLTGGDATRSTGQRSVPVTINGSYQILAESFTGSEQRDELAFLASGPAPDVLWTFDGFGGHIATPATNAAVGIALPLDGGTDAVMTWFPGSSPAILQFAPDPPTSRPSGNSPIGSGYIPLVGDFVGTVGASSVLWYAPGPARERLDIGG